MRGWALVLISIGCSTTPAEKPDLSVDKAARCTDTFGTALTAPYGRLAQQRSPDPGGIGQETKSDFTEKLTPAARVSVFASTWGGDSAHLVHRNAANQDGAIVIDPTGSPLYLLFAFADQSF